MRTTTKQRLTGMIMKRIIIAAGLTYFAMVIFSNLLIVHTPKIARWFRPPTFQFSKSVLSGVARPFYIGMDARVAVQAAKNSNLVTRPCHPIPRIGKFDYPASLCFSYPNTGTFWDVWTKDNAVTAVRIYTTMNVTSE